MSITDELREYALGWDERNRIRGDLEAIADRIDAEHERECKEQYACGAEHGIGASIDALVIQTHGFVELPKDADGEHIHIGDVMEERSGHTFEVASLMAFGGSDNWLVLSDARNLSSFREPHDLRHYHAPTVEDVLREFAERYLDYEGVPSAGRRGIGEALMDEYAAKLQLREDA